MSKLRKLMTPCLRQADCQVLEAVAVASAAVVDANLPDHPAFALARGARRM